MTRGFGRRAAPGFRWALGPEDMSPQYTYKGAFHQISITATRGSIETKLAPGRPACPRDGRQRWIRLLRCGRS